MPSPDSLLRAKNLSRSVLRSALDAEATVSHNKELRSQETKHERERLTAGAHFRVEKHLKVVRCNEDRIVGSDDALKQASSCLRALQHARYGHFASAQVCDRRLELREDRPPKVNGRSAAPCDGAQEALQAQQQTLSATRESLLFLESKARALLAHLETVRTKLTKDAAMRRLAVEQDRAWIISLASISGSSTAKAPPPPPKQPEGIDDGASQALGMHVMMLESTVRQLKAEAAAEVLRLAQESKQVHQQVEELLMRSVYALDAVGKKLKEQAREVDHTIKHAERSVHETRKNLRRGDTVGAAKVDSLDNLIKDLRTTRRELQEDIVLKAALLNVDERCRKVTPAMASERRTGGAANLASTCGPGKMAAHPLRSTAQLFLGGSQDKAGRRSM